MVLLQEEGQLVAEWLGSLLVEMFVSEVLAPSSGREKLLVLLVREEHRLKKRGEMRMVRSVNNIPRS